MGESPNDLVKEVLERLNARNRLIPGARIGFELAKVFDLRAFLKTQSKSLLTYLLSIQDECGLKVVPQKGTDFLVGFSTASVASDAPAPAAAGIRRDVFDAFSRFNNTYFYDAISDEFVKEDAPGRVPAEPIHLEDALRYRREFAESLEAGSAKDEITETLDHGMAALRDFSLALRNHGLTGKWRSSFSAILKKLIVDWAAEKSVKVNPQWFEPSPIRPHKFVAARRSLISALEDLPEEDWSRVLVPLSVVEKMLSRHSR